MRKALAERAERLRKSFESAVDSAADKVESRLSRVVSNVAVSVILASINTVRRVVMALAIALLAITYSCDTMEDRRQNNRLDNLEKVLYDRPSPVGRN